MKKTIIYIVAYIFGFIALYFGFQLTCSWWQLDYLTRLQLFKKFWEQHIIFYTSILIATLCVVYNKLMK